MTTVDAGPADGLVGAPVEVLLRIRWRHVPAVDLRIEAERHHTIADVLEAANATCVAGWEPSQPAYVERTGARLELSSTVARSGLVSGDTVRFELYGVEGPARVDRTVSLDVLGGPEAGRSFVLAAGRYGCGRDPYTAVTIADPTVSALHLTVVVSDDLSTSIVPAENVENPVLVNGVPVHTETAVSPTDVIQFGATAVALRVADGALDESRDQLGQIPFNRTPHRPAVVTERHFAPLGAIPVRQEARRFAALTVLAPLASGLLLYAFSKQVQFLALTMLSPIALIGNWFEDRKSGRHRYTADVARFHERLTERSAAVRQALLDERAERLRAAPDLADLARRAELHSYDLWPRRRGDDEFMTIRLGLGVVTSQVRAPVDDNGDRELRDEAEAALTGHGLLVAAPVAIGLADVGVVALYGSTAEVRPLAAAVVVQAAALHSPEDLVIVTIEPPGRTSSLAGWVKWLPHTRSSTSPLGGPHVVDEPDAARRIIRELIEVGQRRIDAGRGLGDRADHRWPWVLVVVDDDAGIDPALASQLFDLCPASGISVVHTSSRAARTPRQAAAVVRCISPAAGDLSVVWFTDPEREPMRFEPEPASAALTDRVALALAPLRDATAATATTAVPRVVPLLSLFSAIPTAATIAQEWLRDKPYGLAAPIGVGPDGPLVLDLVEHGPHALIGGTSGAGKSELLQSIVASLIAHYPPTRLNFLFVDYKGGASSTVFNGVPHTVGYVTNLEASLALRALTSLRAELNHRMRVMEGRAKDLAEMLERFPAEAPPSLVIVVDEFATLVKEVPEFVAGIVDIAQRGRSLGIHLILATQRPSGSVNDNILANTNLRISLRMLDNSESTSVIGTPAAAEIPVPLKGRAFARLGPGELVPFQSGFTGAPLTRTTSVAPVRCELFGRPPRPTSRRTSTLTALPIGPPQPAPKRAVDDVVLTHLDAVLAAVGAALPDLPAPRRPWREVLPELLSLASVEQAAGRRPMPPSENARNLVVAMADDPAAQDQYPAVIDVEEGGGLLIVGTGGSGKTTALRTIALAAARAASADEVVLYAIDCASRSLRVLGDLPHCAAVATGDDLEAITRVLATLDAEIERRKGILSDLRVQAETLSAYLSGGGRLPRVLLLIDGYQTLAGMLSGLTSDQTGIHDWLADVHRIVTDGRQVGVHVVLTVDRRQSVPALLMSAIANRIVLRQSDEQGYADFGVPTAIAKTLDPPPGRGILNGDLTVQLGVVGERPDAASQGAAIAAAALGLHGVVADALVTRPFPETVTLEDLQSDDGAPMRATLGIADLTLAPVSVDLRPAGLCVVGQPLSGRTTALLTVAESLARGGAEVWTIGPESDTAASLAAGRGKHAGPKAAAAMELLEELAMIAETYPSQTRVLIVDDADLMDDDFAMFALATRVLKTEAVRVIGALEQRNFVGYTENPIVRHLRLLSRRLILQPESVTEVYTTFGLRAPLRPGLKMTPGRGVLVVDRVPTVVQVARPGS